VIARGSTELGVAEEEVDLGRFRTRALSVAGEEPGLLLLHGWAESADSWRPALQALAGRRRAVAVDLPGFGGASPLPDGPILGHLDAFTAAALAELDLGERPVLVGHSLSGLTALRAGGRRAPVRGLVTIAPLTGALPAWQRAVAHLSTPVRLWLRAAPPLPLAAQRPILREVFLRLGVSERSRIPEEAVGRYVAGYRDAAAANRYLAVLLRALAESRDAFVAERVDVPVVVVWGERDRIADPEGARPLADALPDARLELMSGCAHVPHLEEPEVVADLLDGFARELAGRPS